MKKAYHCRTCKKRHAFTSYVFAHWDLPLTSKCDKCGATHEVLRGNATLVQKGWDGDPEDLRVRKFPEAGVTP